MDAPEAYLSPREGLYKSRGVPPVMSWLGCQLATIYGVSGSSRLRRVIGDESINSKTFALDPTGTQAGVSIFSPVRRCTNPPYIVLTSRCILKSNRGIVAIVRRSHPMRNGRRSVASVFRLSHATGARPPATQTTGEVDDTSGSWVDMLVSRKGGAEFCTSTSCSL